MKKLLVVPFSWLLFALALSSPAQAGDCSAASSTCGDVLGNLRTDHIQVNISGNQATFSVRNTGGVSISPRNLCFILEEGKVDDQGPVVNQDLIFLDATGQSLAGADVTMTIPASGWYNIGVYAKGARANPSCVWPKEFQVTLSNETPPPGGATTTPTPAPSKIDCQEGETWVETLNACFTFGGFINTALEWLIIAAALLALFRLTVGGIQYVFSRGQPDSLEAAQATMTSAIFGLILVFIAWLLIQFVGESTPDWWKVDFFSTGGP